MKYPYRVAYPGNVLDDFEQLCLEANDRGLLAEVAAAADEIHDRLRTAPREFGDPCYSLKNTQQDMFVRIVKPLLVHFAVHQTLNIVSVQSISWFSPQP